MTDERKLRSLELLFSQLENPERAIVTLHQVMVEDLSFAVYIPTAYSTQFSLITDQKYIRYLVGGDEAYRFTEASLDIQTEDVLGLILRKVGTIPILPLKIPKKFIVSAITELEQNL